MGRPLRVKYAGAIYHITSRGNERKKIFLVTSRRDVRAERSLKEPWGVWKIDAKIGRRIKHKGGDSDHDLAWVVWIFENRRHLALKRAFWTAEGPVFRKTITAI